MASIAPAPSAAVRRGKELHIPRFAALPPFCVTCGAPAQVPWRKKFYWHSPWLALLILFPGLLIYAIVALIVRKQMELNVPLCDKHHAERKRYSLLGALFALGALPVGIFIGVAFNDAEGFAWLTGVGMFIAGVVFLILAGKYLRPKKIDELGGIFGGASEAFLSQLPNG